MRSNKSGFTVVVAGLAALLVCPAAFSQLSKDQTSKEQTPERRPNAREFPRDRPQMMQMPAMQAARFAFNLERVLTDEQRASLREGMEKQRDKNRDLEEKLRDVRKDLFQASIAEKFDEDAIRKKALEVGKLEAEQTVLRAKAMSQMKPALSSEQLEKLKNPPPFEPGEFRRDMRDQQGQGDRRPRGPRDENDLPPKPKPEN
jgi:Spy/CpxP family protein refolding chaperone